MKKSILFLLTFFSMALPMSMFLSACDSDDGVMPLPQKSNFHYQLETISGDMKEFYDFTVTYLDINGNQITEQIDGWAWDRTQGDGSVNARFFCKIVANKKATLPLVDKENYVFSYEGKLSCYRPDTKVRDFPFSSSTTIAADDVVQYVNDHPTIEICSVDL